LHPFVSSKENKACQFGSYFSGLYYKHSMIVILLS
jgi:hypothetical protein